MKVKKRSSEESHQHSGHLLDHPSYSESRVSLNADVIMEILSRVPATSVVRFSRVCKLWNNLRHDPSFKELHFKRTREAAGSVSAITLSHPPPTEGKEKRRTLITLLDDSFVPKYTCPVPPIFSKMTASCNGLVCIHDDHCGIAQVLNPATGEHVQLPKPTDAVYVLNYFFGFHPSTMEYKVVATCIGKRDHGHGHQPGGFQFQVLTLGRGNHSWRLLSYFRLAPNRVAVCIDGVMYWYHHNLFIMAFDLKEETFMPLSCPDIGENRDYYDISTIELEGKLCMGALEYRRYPVHFDLWILNDEATNGWIHKYRIDLSDHLPFDSSYSLLLLVYKGKGLFRLNQRLCYCDLQSSNPSFQEIDDCGNVDWMMARADHVESLVSLKGLVSP